MKQLKEWRRVLGDDLSGVDTQLTAEQCLTTPAPRSSPAPADIRPIEPINLNKSITPVLPKGSPSSSSLLAQHPQPAQKHQRLNDFFAAAAAKLTHDPPAPANIPPPPLLPSPPLSPTVKFPVKIVTSDADKPEVITFSSNQPDDDFRCVPAEDNHDENARPPNN